MLYPLSYGGLAWPQFDDPLSFRLEKLSGPYASSRTPRYTGWYRVACSPSVAEGLAYR